MLSKKLAVALVISGAMTSANGVVLQKVYDDRVDAIVPSSNTNATPDSANSRGVNYQDKNLANYQDPYLTNPRAYQSNQYGEAAPAPKPNVFYRGTAPVYNAREAAIIENQGYEPASGEPLPIDAKEY